MSATVFTPAREMAAIRVQTRRSQVVSAGVHLAVLLWLMLHRHLAPAPEQLVEVTWLEPAPEPAPVVAEAVPAEREATVPEPEPAPVATPESREVRFERPAAVAEEAPRPQDATASRDALRARLEKLEPVSRSSAALTAAAVPQRRVLTATSTRPVTDAAATDGALRRAATPAPATELTRSAAPTRRPSLAAATPASSALKQIQETPPATETERILGSARLSGEVANRPVTDHVMPDYPEWATRQAVEADVTLQFVVLPDGRIKEGIQVARTAGFLDFDDAAVAALRRWRFAALPAGQSAEQRGSITFHFRLRDQR